MTRRILFAIDRNNMTFAAQKTYSTGNDSLPVNLAVFDVNNDNKPDIIVANQHGFNVGVILNNGSGTFLSQATYLTGSNSHPKFVSIADINGDNKPDILVANSGQFNFGIFFNVGNGIFSPAKSYTLEDRLNPPSVIGADVNNDKKADIILVDQNKNIIIVIVNPGDSMFLSAIGYHLDQGTGPMSPSVVDINDDNYPDIIWANYNGNSVGVLFNSGNGRFLPQTTYSTGNNSSPRCVSVVDLNGDNKPEIIVANHNEHNVGILVNIGNGRFLPEKTYSTGPNSNPQFLSVVDVNGDGKPDIVVANSNMDNVDVMLAT
jgi:hypothetical protein